MKKRSVSESEIIQAEERAAEIRRQKEESREENFVFEQVIEKIVKESSQFAVDIIRGAKDFKIKSEDPNGKVDITFTKDGKEYILKLATKLSINSRNIVGQTKLGKITKPDYEQLIAFNTYAELYSGGYCVWDSHFSVKTALKKLNEGMNYPNLSEEDLIRNIRAASTVYVMDALRKEMEKSELKSKVLSATESLRIEGYNREPFYGPQYSAGK